MYRSFEGWFRHHPLRMPIFLIVFGAAFTVAEFASGVHLIFLGAAGAIAFVVGVLLLPFGVVTTVKRRRPVRLHCPYCGTVSQEAEHPFRIERFEHVEYAHVTCSHCGRDFTTDKYQNLA